MVRSLTFKLVLAFLVTSVAGMALAAIFIRRAVTREFDSYVIAQQRAGFIEDVAAYYAGSGSWAGVDGWLRERTARQGDATSQTPRPRRVRFALADASGVVVVPFGPYELGRTIDSAGLARGAPVTVGGRVVGTVIEPELPDIRTFAEQRYLARTDTALGIATVAMVCVALALGLLLARVITRPVRELTGAAQQIAAGDLTQRVPVRSRDELGTLAAQFNHMSADLARATELRRQMTVDVAHDLRTPLTVLSGYLEALRDQVLKPTPERFATMYDEVQLLLRLADDLHTLALADAGELPIERRPIAPRQLLERVAETYRHSATQHGIALNVAEDSAVPETSVDVAQMTRALSNLVVNALRYTPPGGQVRLAARRKPDHLELSVSDSGVGIPPEHLPSIFERFYRVDPSRQQATGGSGLGLAIVKSIVEAHGGAVCVESRVGAGTTFTVALPLEMT